jgi:hypothetical protein
MRAKQRRQRDGIEGWTPEAIILTKLSIAISWIFCLAKAKRQNLLR